MAHRRRKKEDEDEESRKTLWWWPQDVSLEESTRHYTASLDMLVEATSAAAVVTERERAAQLIEEWKEWEGMVDPETKERRRGALCRTGAKLAAAQGGSRDTGLPRVFGNTEPPVGKDWRTLCRELQDPDW